MFYDTFVQLCEQNGIKPTRAAIEAGVPKSAVSYWKSNWEKNIEVLPTNKNALLLAKYFGVSIDILLGKESNTSAKIITEDDIKFALFNGDKDISDEAYNEVKSFAEFVKHKYKKEKK